MSRYHFNPATGRPSICKATQGKCPFLLEGARHYDTKEEAQAGIEKFYTETYTSLAGRLTVQRSRVHHEIIFKMADASYAELIPLLNERSEIEKAIEELEPADDEVMPKLTTKPMKLTHGTLNKDQGDKIIGFSNTIEGFKEASKENFDAAIEISEEWVSRLTTEEVKVLVEYTHHTEVSASNRELFDKALKKSPPLEPTTVYSGLSKYVANDVLRQLDSGIVNIDYPISTSLNAAQINGFMRHTGDDMEVLRGNETLHEVAIEIETTSGAPLMALSTNPHEFEVLLSSGSYEVVNIREDVTMLWGEDGLGRTANQLIKLRRLS
jgi:hypothetical protein